MTYTCTIDASCIRKTVAVRLKEAFVLSSHSAVAKLHLHYCAQLWTPPCKEDIESSGGPLRWLGVGVQHVQRRMQELDLFSLEKRKLRRPPIAVSNCLVSGYREAVVKHFLA